MHTKKINESFHCLLDKYYPPQGKTRKGDVDNLHVITVSAVIAPASLHCSTDHQGKFHQHFYVYIKRVLEGDIDIVTGDLTFVAVHFGDSEGIANQIPDLKPGTPIILKGKFVPAEEAYQTADNPGYSVLHFTHHPVGYIIYHKIKYE
ncbi:MAG: hypothetical protein WA118_00245 [Carboxydocellales bacterium]